MPELCCRRCNSISVLAYPRAVTSDWTVGKSRLRLIGPAKRINEPKPTPEVITQMVGWRPNLVARMPANRAPSGMAP